MQLLVRLGRLRTKPVCGAIVLHLVAGNARATGWHFRERMFITVYANETGLGDADPHRAPALRVLAPWFLGMVGLSSRVRISLRSGVFSAIANNSNSRYFEESYIPLISGRIHLTNVVATSLWGVYIFRIRNGAQRRGYSALRL